MTCRVLGPAFMPRDSLGPVRLRWDIGHSSIILHMGGGRGWANQGIREGILTTTSKIRNPYRCLAEASRPGVSIWRSSYLPANCHSARACVFPPSIFAFGASPFCSSSSPPQSKSNASIPWIGLGYIKYGPIHNPLQAGQSNPSLL